MKINMLLPPPAAAKGFSSLTKGALLGLALLAPASLAAQELRPTYNEAYVGYLRYKGGSEGVTAQARVEIADNWAVGGAIFDNKTDFLGYTQRNRAYQVNGLFHTPIAAQTDFVARATYQRSNLRYEVPGRADQKAHANSYSVDVGIKHRVNEAFQIQPTVGFAYSPSNEDLTSYRSPYANVDASYDFAPNWGISANVSLYKAGAWQWNIGPRFTW